MTHLGALKQEYKRKTHLAYFLSEVIYEMCHILNCGFQIK